MSDQSHGIPQTMRAVIVLGGLACGSAMEPPVGNSASYPGFTLYSEFGRDETILVDEDNDVVHTWEHDRVGGYAVYLLPNGNVIRPALSSTCLAGTVRSSSIESSSVPGRIHGSLVR